ncbi:MAG TPA: DUF885 domain-containing protein [Micromonosporaceae bacterium]
MPSPIFDLCDEYVTSYAALHPVFATMRGVPGYDGEAGDFGPEGAGARATLIRTTLRRLDVLEPVGDADRIAAAHLRERLSADLAWYDAGEWMRDVRASFGLVQSLRDSVDMIAHRDDDGWRLVAGRLRDVPRALGTWRDALREGLARGLVASRRQALDAAIQADTYAGTGGRTPTHAALVASYGDGPLRAELEDAARLAHGAYQETARFLRDRYAPQATERDGVGADRYRIWSRMALGADVDPVEAYEWGWAELYRLEEQMVAEAAAIRTGATLDEVEALLDGSEYVDGPDAYRAWLQDQHDRAIERLDGVHFDLDPALRRVEVVLAPDSGTAGVYYTGPTEDGTRPGRTWWSVAGRQRFTIWEELTTVFHEGVPGHHLQVGTARLAGDSLSRFSRVTGVSGHSEGWALYAERFADELGWYTRPGQRLGMLKAQAMRAARVIIDIGLHLDLPMPEREVPRYGSRWTFEVAERVMRERAREAEHRVYSEVSRYCGWPAQATAYKLGERAWLAAREAARRDLGDRFDLRRWHSEALAIGPAGLSTFADALAARTAAW